MYSKFAPARYARAPFFGTLNSIFDDNFFGKDFHHNVPAVNVHESEKKWDLEVAAPGFKKEDFKITFENDVLTISAEHKEEVKSGDKNFSRREFRVSSFTRSFRLEKKDVNENEVKASYENGILTVSLPKAEEVKKEEVKEIRVA